MTAPLLLALIGAALLVQFAVGFGRALRRRRGTATALPAMAGTVASIGVWPGWR